MEYYERIKKFDGIHLVFWLLKDSCWMLGFKWLAVTMVIPTLLISGVIIYISRKTNDVFMNLAVFFWIAANSAWMMNEFYYRGENKTFTATLFGAGFICIGIYFFKQFKTKDLSQKL